MLQWRKNKQKVAWCMTELISLCANRTRVFPCEERCRQKQQPLGGEGTSRHSDLSVQLIWSQAVSVYCSGHPGADQWSVHFVISCRVTACSRQPTSPSSTATKRWERSGSSGHLQKETPSFSFQKVCSQEINDSFFCSFGQLSYQTVPNEFYETLFASCAENQKSF